MVLNPLPKLLAFCTCLLRFQSGATVYAMGRQQRMVQVVGTLHPCGDVKEVLDQFNSDHCTYLGSESVDGKCSVFLSVFTSLKSAFQIIIYNMCVYIYNF